MTPPCTLTASGTSSPLRASRTERATAMPAFSWASSVDAPRWGVATTFSSSKSGLSVHGSLAKTSRPAAAIWPGLEGVVERGLVDDPAAGGVDEDQARLRAGQLVGADQPDRLRRLGQVDAHEVGLGEQGVEVDEADAHLRGAAGLHVGVVGDDLHAEGAEALGDQDADAAEADDADGLLVELDAGVLRALPLAAAERGVGRADVAGRGEHQGDGELGGADDVGGRRVDDHDAGLGGGLHVDVVETDARAGDDLEATRRRRGPRRRPWWRSGPGSRRRRRSPGAARRGRHRCSCGSRSPGRAPRSWRGSALRR